MLIIDNQSNTDFSTQKLEMIFEQLSQKDLELIFVDNKSIQKINYEFRNKNKPTDVLSFPLVDMPHSPLGSIVISVEKAISVSEELGHSLEDELCLLFIHGFLHVSGYDHESDDGQMREEEEKLIRRFDLPKSLILRTQG